MNEITRIHLAKVPYNIEISTKKSLEKYCKDLAFYAGDDEVMQDIETRMTELFAERGVKKDGVITADDVTAIRRQLGEPSDFAPEGAGDIAVGMDHENEPNRRLYRDTENAMLGGVLSGMARFFGINPMWTRLIFVVILIASFGTALVIYLILWVVVPPARTAAEKLQMDGQPVTLESIKRLGEQAAPVANKTAQVLKDVLIVGAGVLLLLIAIGALMTTMVVGGTYVFGGSSRFGAEITTSVWFISAFWLFIVSGLLLTALCALLSIATFRRRWLPHMTIATVVIIVVGVLTFTSGVVMAIYGSNAVRSYDSRTLTRVNLPGNFQHITTLTIKSNDGSIPDARIEYVVSDASYWQLDGFSGIKPQIEMADDGVSANIKLITTEKTATHRWNVTQPVLYVYGPALTGITLDQNTTFHYNGNNKQNELTVNANGAFELGGAYETVNAVVNGGSLDAQNAAITNLTIDNKNGDVTAGVVRNFAVTWPDSCAVDADNASTTVNVWAVSSGKITYNGVEQPVKNMKNACGELTIESEEKS